MAGRITSGRVTVKQVTPKALAATRIVTRLGGRKTYGLNVGDGFAIGKDITVVRVDDGRDGHLRLVVQAPTSVFLGHIEQISLTG